MATFRDPFNFTQQLKRSLIKNKKKQLKRSSYARSSKPATDGPAQKRRNANFSLAAGTRT
jgi:hypothetical protein